MWYLQNSFLLFISSSTSLGFGPDTGRGFSIVGERSQKFLHGLGGIFSGIIIGFHVFRSLELYWSFVSLH